MCQLLDLAEEKQGFKSDYQLHKETGISKELISKWRTGKSRPNGEHSLYLASMAGLTTDEALKIVRNGYAEIGILIGMGFTTVATLALSRFAAIPLLQAISDSGILYIM